MDVIHTGKPPVAKADLRSHVAKLHKSNINQVILYGFKTAFGGGHTTGFGLIYDSPEDIKKFEPRYRFVNYHCCCTGIGPICLIRLTYPTLHICRQLRIGEGAKKTRTRKQWKDLKKKKRTTFGTGRREAVRAAKKAAAS